MVKFENLILKSEFYKNYGHFKFDESFIESLEEKFLNKDVKIFEILLKIGTDKNLIHQLIFEFLKDTKFDIKQFNNINDFIYDQLEYYIWPFYTPVNELRDLYEKDKIKIYKCLTPRLERYLQKIGIFIHPKIILKDSNIDMKSYTTEKNFLIKNVIKNTDTEVINYFLEKDAENYGNDYFSKNVGFVNKNHYSLRVYNHQHNFPHDMGNVGVIGNTGFIGSFGNTGFIGSLVDPSWIGPFGVQGRSDCIGNNYIYHHNINNIPKLDKETIFLNRINKIKLQKEKKINKIEIWNKLFENLTMTEVIYIFSHKYDKKEILSLIENTSILKNYLFKDKVDDLCTYIKNEFKIDISKLL
jgi:hypothetical protein